MRKGNKPLRLGSKIDLSSIRRAAFAVLDAEGYEGLTIRAVAARLHVQPPALYWHVRSRAELVTQLASTYMDAAAQRESDADRWPQMLKQFAQGLRVEMLRHRDSAKLCLAAEPQGRPSDLISKRLAPLVKDGLDVQQALHCLASIMAYTVGWVGYQQSPAMHEYLLELIDFDTSFERGLDALIAGFAAKTVQRAKTVARAKPLGRRRASP